VSLALPLLPPLLLLLLLLPLICPRGLQGVQLPVLLPGAKQAFVPLSPSLSDEDKQVVENVVKIGEWAAAACVYCLVKL
jgi:hypothetical protein